MTDADWLKLLIRFDVFILAIMVFAYLMKLEHQGYLLLPLTIGMCGTIFFALKWALFS